MKYPDEMFTKEQLKKLEEPLMLEHRYFFHCTPEVNLKSIRLEGLDVRYSNADRRVRNEPPVMRFCTCAELSHTFGMICNDTNSDIDTPAQGVAIIRVQALALLSRHFGLDWSMSQTSAIAQAEFKKDCERDLTEYEVRVLVRRIGYLSCYETLPAEELEFSKDGRQVFVPFANS